jgi:enoyl-CoA hydratase/carnithine racemase
MRPSLRYTSARPLEELVQSRCHVETFAAADLCAGSRDVRVVALLTFLPGSRPVNVIDLEFIAQLRAALVWLQQRDPPVSFALLSSSVPGSFVAGADLKMQANLTDEAEASAQSAGLLEYTCLFHSMPFVTVALVEGSALGGGLELALACHLCVARPVWNKHGTEAQCLSLPEVKLGVLPGAGGCVRLPLRIGLLPALNMILQGSSVTASQGMKMGIIDALWKDQGPRQPGLPPPPEFFPWIVNALLEKTVRSRSSDGGGLLGLILRVRPFSTLLRHFTRKQINAKTRGHFPAPYAALDAVMACWCSSVGAKSKQWPHHFSVDPRSCAAESRAFGRLAISPECKALISLFLASKLPAKLAPPAPIPGTALAPNRAAVMFGGHLVSPDGCTLALTVALLLSGIDVVMFAPLEAFECVVAAAKQSLQQRVLKRTISASAMDESLARLQHSSHADAGHYTGPLLFIPNQAEYHQPQVSFSAFPAASCFILGPVARVTPEAGLAPALCCLNWSGGISTMAEVVVGDPSKMSDSFASAAAAAAALGRSSGLGVSFTSGGMSGSFEVSCDFPPFLLFVKPLLGILRYFCARSVSHCLRR